MAIGCTPSLLFVLAAATLVAGPATAPLMTRPTWDDEVRVTVPASVHPALARRAPTGSVAPDLALDNMILVLKLPQEAQGRLDQLLKDQQDPASGNYHRWLTPESFGQQFGPSQDQVDAATLWLLQQGFTVHGAARSGLAITFSGTAAQVGHAFRTAIMTYDVDGETRHGNASAISLPQGLAGFVGGVASLHDLRRKADHQVLGPLARPLAHGPDSTNSAGTNYIGAADFAAIYNLRPLFSAGTTGTGVAIGVVGRTDTAVSDHQAFVTSFSLSAYGGQMEVLHNGPDPGVINLNEQFEADIDTQWSTAAAPGADIKFVVSASSVTTDGVDLSSQYLVDNNLAPVITSSFGSCEAQMGSAETTIYNQLWAQAAGQGISVFVATGDNGVAGCDSPELFQGTGKGVSGLASTPYNTAVGGTMFNEGSGSYWNAPSGQIFAGNAKGYIPEAVWNESGNTANGERLVAGSGGVSTVYAKPSWQAALNVPTDFRRDLPDVSFSAASGHDPYLVSLPDGFYLAGGTSVASPCMAGIMALVVQKFGRQGNPNPTLYTLARAQYAGTGPAVFHDVTTGDNSVPGVSGFTAGPGYDLATGLGSLDGTALVNNWVAGANPITTSISSPAAPVTIASGGTVNFNGSGGTTAGGVTLTYTWAFGDGATAMTPTASHAYVIQGSQSQTFVATLTVSDGTYAQSRSVKVTVTPAGVSATIQTPVLAVYGFPNQAIAFSATATTVNASTITGYSWSFGDGGTAIGANVTHSFASSSQGGYEVTVTATDGTGARGQAAVPVFANTAWAMDLNFDNTVDVRDLLTLCGAWGTAATSASLLNGFYPWGADFNGDGKIDDTDLNLWLNNFVPGAQ